jgi:glycosyltransferase involved in cell wall biosynthesis
MNNPLINILVRTSNRPNFFSNCYKSIREQDYKNIRLIVSYDDETTKGYLQEYEIDALVPFQRFEDWSFIENIAFLPGYLEKPFPPNEYFNRMMEHTQPGYIIKLDDDNKFTSSGTLSKIAEKINATDQMILWRVQFPGYVIPDNQHFGTTPHCCQIDTACFAFHTDYIRFAGWDGYMYSDFRVAMCLFLHIPQKVYINEALVALQDKPGNGLRNDLSISNKPHYEI